MVDEERKALEVREKAELTTASEHMKQGPTFMPAGDIFETDKEIRQSRDYIRKKG